MSDIDADIIRLKRQAAETEARLAAMDIAIVELKQITNLSPRLRSLPLEIPDETPDARSPADPARIAEENAATAADIAKRTAPADPNVAADMAAAQLSQPTG